MALNHRNRRGFMTVVGSALAYTSCFCGRATAAQDKARDRPISGDSKSTKSGMLEAGADALQSRAPIDAINVYLNGFHFYADDMGRQIEAHHYCHHVNEDFFQCVIFDSNEANARLIGIEYIVSERMFETLPDDEKRLWHSHRHETTSGELVMPGIPMPVEHTAIATLVNTYGKTWQTWQIDKHAALPLGIPQLMMGFTQDGQLDRENVRRRDHELGIDTSKERANRSDLAKSAAPVQAGADDWHTGKTLQLTLSKTSLRNQRG